MDKFLITFKSGNRITGPIMITTRCGLCVTLRRRPSCDRWI